MKYKKLSLLVAVMLVLSLFLVTGFTTKRQNTHTVYRVYLKGKSLGIIKSKDSLEKYINKKQAEIKEKYNVKKVYVPSELDIVKEITYDDDLTSVEKIYNKIKDISPFTISGYAVKIKGVDSKDSAGKTIKGKNQTIYVLDKKVFSNSVNNIVKSFIPEDEYNAFVNDTQKEIEDVGKIIEKIYIENTITIRKQKVPVDKKIYQEEKELSKYLLFGTTEDQQKYTVKAGDTIEDVAFDNKMSTEEFLISNPSISNAKSLLYAGQEVTLGILKPQFNVVEKDYVVIQEEKKYTTETKYDDSKYLGYTEIQQKGSNGLNRVTQIITKVNGATTNITPAGTEVIKEPINEIIIKGGKKSMYNGYGSVLPTKGEWGWPASCASISSPFGYRWGILHDGVDIAGCGYGSNVFAAMDGTVVESKRTYGSFAGGYGTNGEYITIDHHNGYYTMYAHLCPGCRYVKVGDTVSKGQIIAGMGQTGWATGVHLHFSIWRGFPYYPGSRALNPMAYY